LAFSEGGKEKEGNGRREEEEGKRREGKGWRREGKEGWLKQSRGIAFENMSAIKPIISRLR
jgi:hypothetical protein